MSDAAARARTDRQSNLPLPFAMPLLTTKEYEQKNHELQLSLFPQKVLSIFKLCFKVRTGT